MAVRSQPMKDHWKEQRLFLSRVIGAAVCVVMLTGVLIWRLVDLQVVDYQHFSDRSQNQRIKVLAVAPTRGQIYDREGRVLARNEPSWQLVAMPEDVDDIETVLSELQGLGLLSPDDLPAQIERVRSQPGWKPVLLANLNEKQAATFAVRGHQFQGIDIQAGLIRFYPLDDAAAHAVGYVSSLSTADFERVDRSNYRDTLQIGKTGVERAYEDRLHGTEGLRVQVFDAHSRPTEEPVPENYDVTKAPVPGEHVHLGIDIEVQRAAHGALAGLRGTAVAIDPRNGDVLTLVSMPAYDSNDFASGMSNTEFQALNADPGKPFLNRALSSPYSPGSTIKPFLALAGLHYEAEHVTEDHVCEGAYRLPLAGSLQVYRESRRVLPHGETSLHSAIVRSCNVYFYGLGYELGIDRMEEFFGRFGFGTRLGIDIVGEYAGRNPGREWKRSAFRNREDQAWYPGETVINSIGQGYIEVTPLQLAHAVATLAVRGERYEPRLMVATENAESGEMSYELPNALEGIFDISPEYWQQIHDAMLGVTTEVRGTGRTALGDAGYTVAGKTGTAQVVGVAQSIVPEGEELEERYRDNGLFIAFAPAENPEIAVAVVVEHQGGGGSTAAPVARKMLDAYFGNREYVAQLLAL